MLRFRLLLWFILIFASSVSARQILEGYSVVRGKDYAFEIKAPRSWVLDNEAAKEPGNNLGLLSDRHKLGNQQSSHLCAGSHERSLRFGILLTR